MKTFMTIAALCIGLLGTAQNEGVTLTVIIENLSNDDGKAGIALYDEATFMKAAPLQEASSEITDRQVTLILENVTPGTYGITALHDKNGNNRMDFEPNGMPKEAYGVSNNIMSFGPPQWDDAKFNVGTDDKTITIRF